MKVNDKLYCISVYKINDGYVVRRCCDIGYSWHALGGSKLPQCNCEIVASGLTKDEAIAMGQNLSNELQVALFIDNY